MKVTLPFIKRDEAKDGVRIFETEDRAVELDNTLVAQMRWEAAFPELAKRESIIDYAERVKDAPSGSVAVLIARLKVLYCFFKMPCAFEDFLAMFDWSQKEYAERLVNAIKEALDLIFGTASEKN